MFIIVTKPANMRGLDYRAEVPIALFLAKLCDSKRALYQAFGRVGRYAEDRCWRLVDEALGVDPLEAFDPEAVSAREDALMKVIMRKNAPPPVSSIATRRGQKAT